MDSLQIGLTGFAVLLAMLAVRIPIGVAMLAVGIGGYYSIAGPVALMSFLKTQTYWVFTSDNLSVVPLFILMGQFASKAGLSQALFRAANVWLGHHRGGIAMAAVGGCAGFGAITGSSLATAATMGQVALPELRRYNYSGGLATAALAAGGTLGILIPPSIVLIIFAVMVEANVGSLFQAAFIPGILAALGYIVAIAVVVRLNPAAGPAGERQPYGVRFRALLDIWPVLIIFLLVMGGIYAGIFTPTEGAGVGAIGTFIIAITKGGMRTDGFVEAILETAQTTGMIFLILLGATLFNAFLGFSQLPIYAADFFQNSKMSPYAVLFGMILLYILLGMVMDSLSMILLTIPIFWPVIAGLEAGFPVQGDDLKVWFGIITLIVVEMGLITPPVGLNVFVINSMAKDVPMIETFKGVIPFLISDFVRVGLIILLPSLVLFMPRLLGQ
ncbi:MAG: TRAP transporter large permease [Beijerinckiaceae bacterium]